MIQMIKGWHYSMVHTYISLSRLAGLFSTHHGITYIQTVHIPGVPDENITRKEACEVK